MSSIIYLHQFRTVKQTIDTSYSGRDDEDDYLDEDEDELDFDDEDELEDFEEE